MVAGLESVVPNCRIGAREDGKPPARFQDKQPAGLFFARTRSECFVSLLYGVRVVLRCFQAKPFCRAGSGFASLGWWSIAGSGERRAPMLVWCNDGLAPDEDGKAEAVKARGVK